MKRNCRRTDDERDQHDRATRIRKMTDAQICSYIDGLEQKAAAIQEAAKASESNTARIMAEVIAGAMKDTIDKYCTPPVSSTL